MNIARFIHQAMVRRGVMLKCIEAMKRRGHRAFQNIVMGEVITTVAK